MPSSVTVKPWSSVDISASGPSAIQRWLNKRSENTLFTNKWHGVWWRKVWLLYKFTFTDGTTLFRTCQSPVDSAVAAQCTTMRTISTCHSLPTTSCIIVLRMHILLVVITIFYLVLLFMFTDCRLYSIAFLDRPGRIGQTSRSGAQQ